MRFPAVKDLPEQEFNLVASLEDVLREEGLDEGILVQMEWRAWHLVVDELRKLGIDVNDADSLCASINIWGQLLALLRLAQDPGNIDYCIDEIKRWEPKVE